MSHRIREPAIWCGCSLYYKDGEAKRWSKKRKNEDASPRYFLTLSTSTKPENENLYNSLLLFTQQGQFWLFRSLWHGCTASHCLEVTPCSFFSQRPLHNAASLTVIHCGSVGISLASLRRLIWRPACSIELAFSRDYASLPHCSKPFLPLTSNTQFRHRCSQWLKLSSSTTSLSMRVNSRRCSAFSHSSIQNQPRLPFSSFKEPSVAASRSSSAAF